MTQDQLKQRFCPRLILSFWRGNTRNPLHCFHTAFLCLNTVNFLDRFLREVGPRHLTILLRTSSSATTLQITRHPTLGRLLPTRVLWTPHHYFQSVMSPDVEFIVGSGRRRAVGGQPWAANDVF